MPVLIHKIKTWFIQADWVERNNILLMIVLCMSLYLTPVAVLVIILPYMKRIKLHDLRSLGSDLAFPYFFLAVNALVTSLYSWNALSIGATIGVIIPFYIYGVYAETQLSPKSCILMLKLLVFLSLPVGLYAIIQKLFIHLVEGRVTSTFVNANLYAFYLMIVLLIAFGFFLETSSKKEKWGYAGISLINMAALLLTSSRTVLVALAIAFLFLLLLSNRYQLALVLLGLCGVFLYSVTINPGLIPRYTVLDANISTREQLWNIAWDAIRTNPLIGRGLLSYKFYALQYNVTKVHAHNMLLNVWVEWGIAGVVLLGWSYFIVFKRGILGLKYSPYRKQIAIILSCIVGAFIYGIVDNPIINVQTGLLFTLLCSMILVFARKTPDKPIQEK